MISVGGYFLFLLLCVLVKLERIMGIKYESAKGKGHATPDQDQVQREIDAEKIIVEKAEDQGRDNQRLGNFADMFGIDNHALIQHQDAAQNQQ